MTFESQDRRDISYRPEVDGLRAVAVLSVMACHARLPGFGGGYVGVDVFFVISGYLITGILARQATKGELSLLRFYQRRARRILPALYLVMAVATLLGVLIMLPTALSSFGASLAASSLFAANFYFWQHSGGYFDDPVATMPLVHLWSLAVEEQFYLLYPLVLAAIWRWRPNWLMPSILVALAVSLAASEVASLVSPIANFFLLPTRGWELLAGAALALREQERARENPQPPSLTSQIGAALGLVMIAVCVAFYDDGTRIPGLAAVPVVLGTLLLLGCARPSHGVGRLLASRVSVAIGLASYSAYLWHQVLLAFVRDSSGTDRLSMPMALATLATCLALAFASWRWVERPFRHGLLSARRFTAMALAGALAFVAVGLVLWKSDGLPARLSPESRTLLELPAQSRARLQRCTYLGDAGLRELQLPGDPSCLRGREGPIGYAFVGDSHAGAIAPAFDPLLARRRERGLVVAVSACAPILNDILAVPDRAGCTELHRRTLNYLLAHPEIHTIVLAARWPYYLERSGFDNGEGGVEEIPTDRLDATRRAAIGAAFAEMPRRLLAAGRRVILVYPVPEAGWSVPVQVVRRRMRFADPPPLSVSHDRVIARTAAATAALDRIGTHPRLVRLYPERALCTLERGTRCRLELEGRPLYWDAHHLTEEAAQLALPALEHTVPGRAR